MASLTKVKEGKNWSLWTDGKSELLKVVGVRCSFPNVGSIQEQVDETTGKKSLSWNITAMLHKKEHSEASKEFIGILNRIAAKNEVTIKRENKCMKDGDGEGQERKEYEGHYTISVKNHSKQRPSVRDQKGTPMVEEAKIDDKFYGGCYVSLMLRPWYFNGKSKSDPSKTFPKRLLCGMTTVAFFKDGEPFGEGSVDDSDAWSGGEDGGDDGMGGGATEDDDGL